MFIHEQEDWPRFRWDAGGLADPLAAVRHRQGMLLGRMSSFGLDVREAASLVVSTEDVVQSGAIEGEILDAGSVRSSIARRLGLEVGPSGRSTGASTAWSR